MHGSSNDIYNISDLGKQLGKMKAQSILGIHAFTGCDVSGKCKSKATWIKLLLQADEDILYTFASLGSKIPAKFIEQFEKFVCNGYCNNSIETKRLS